MHTPTTLTNTNSNTTLSQLEKALNIPYLKNRHFGKHGGRYVPELLIPALEELEKVFLNSLQSKDFQTHLKKLFHTFAGRPTPFFYAENFSKHCNGVKIYIKNEGNLTTGAHKFNNALGQALLCKQLGKSKVIAETGAGQHGLAVSSAAAKLNLQCTIFMGELDIARQQPNVLQMKQMGSEVITVRDGDKTLKDAVNASLKYWIENLNDTHYILGSALGPFPFPAIVRTFQSIIGNEVREQLKNENIENPQAIVASVGGGSNSLGIFAPFINNAEVELFGVEAGGKGNDIGQHAARFRSPQVGICQGYKSYFLQDTEGQLQKTHSISAGLDYAGISPELAHLYDIKRIQFLAASDAETIEAYKLLARCEGITAALESAHAAAKVIEISKNFSKGDVLVLNISGRGDKDLFISAPKINKDSWAKFLISELHNMKTTT